MLQFAHPWANKVSASKAISGLGLALVRAIEADEGFAARATQALQAADRSSPEAELDVLMRLAEGDAPAQTPLLDTDARPGPA